VGIFKAERAATDLPVLIAKRAAKNQTMKRDASLVERVCPVCLSSYRDAVLIYMRSTAHLPLRLALTPLRVLYAASSHSIDKKPLTDLHAFWPRKELFWPSG
jgi:hypothetical protein